MTTVEDVVNNILVGMELTDSPINRTFKVKVSAKEYKVLKDFATKDFISVRDRIYEGQYWQDIITTSYCMSVVYYTDALRVYLAKSEYWKQMCKKQGLSVYNHIPAVDTICMEIETI